MYQSVTTLNYDSADRYQRIQKTSVADSVKESAINWPNLGSTDMLNAI